MSRSIPNLFAAHECTNRVLCRFRFVDNKNFIRGERSLDCRARSRDYGRAARRDLKNPPSTHGRGRDDRIHIQKDFVLSIGRQHLTVRERTHYMGIKRRRKRILLVSAMLARENFESVFHVIAYLECGTEKQFHLFTSIFIFVGEIHSRKRDISGRTITPTTNRVMYCRRSCEGQHVDTVMPQLRAVLGQTCTVGRKNEIEKFGRFQKIVKVRWVFLVPEHGRHAGFFAPVYEFNYIRTRGTRTCQVISPRSAVSSPR